MEETVRRDILDVLKQGIEALRKQDSFKIKELSNHVIHDASIFQDEDSIAIAVMMYSLSKIMERGKLDLEEIIRLFQKAAIHLDQSAYESYRQTIKLIVKRISTADSRLKLFVSSVIEQAQIKKGCKICAHGISVATVANLLGVPQWELRKYLGITGFHEDMPETVSAKERLGLARKVLS